MSRIRRNDIAQYFDVVDDSGSHESATCSLSLFDCCDGAELVSRKMYSHKDSSHYRRFFRRSKLATNGSARCSCEHLHCCTELRNNHGHPTGGGSIQLSHLNTEVKHGCSRRILLKDYSEPSKEDFGKFLGQNLLWLFIQCGMNTYLSLVRLLLIVFISLNFGAHGKSWLLFDRSTSMWLVGSFIILFFPLTDSCSTRPSAKPRPPRPIWSPDLISQRTNCTEDYSNLWCQNGGTCFQTKLYDNTFELGCECSPNWYGRRCEYLDVGVLPVQQRIETASIAGGVTVLVILLIVTAFILYVYRRRSKIRASGRHASPSIFDEPDHHIASGDLPVRPFSIRRSTKDNVRCAVHSVNEENGIIVTPIHDRKTQTHILLSGGNTSNPNSQTHEILRL